MNSRITIKNKIKNKSKSKKLKGGTTPAAPEIKTGSVKTAVDAINNKTAAPPAPPATDPTAPPATTPDTAPLATAPVTPDAAPATAPPVTDAPPVAPPADAPATPVTDATPAAPPDATPVTDASGNDASGNDSSSSPPTKQKCFFTVVKDTTLPYVKVIADYATDKGSRLILGSNNKTKKSRKEDSGGIGGIIKKTAAITISNFNDFLESPSFQQTLSETVNKTNQITQKFLEETNAKLNTQQNQDNFTNYVKNIAKYSDIAAKKLNKPVDNLLETMHNSVFDVAKSIAVGVVKTAVSAATAVPGVGTVLAIPKITDSVANIAYSGFKATANTTAAVANLSKKMSEVGDSSSGDGDGDSGDGDGDGDSSDSSDDDSSSSSSSSSNGDSKSSSTPEKPKVIEKEDTYYKLEKVQSGGTQIYNLQKAGNKIMNRLHKSIHSFNYPLKNKTKEKYFYSNKKNNYTNNTNTRKHVRFTI
jgi:hypothetical protein